MYSIVQNFEPSGMLSNTCNMIQFNDTYNGRSVKISSFYDRF